MPLPCHLASAALGPAAYAKLLRAVISDMSALCAVLKALQAAWRPVRTPEALGGARAVNPRRLLLGAGGLVCLQKATAAFTGVAGKARSCDCARGTGLVGWHLGDRKAGVRVRAMSKSVKRLAVPVARTSKVSARVCTGGCSEPNTTEALYCRDGV